VIPPASYDLNIEAYTGRFREDQPVEANHASMEVTRFG
jgi:hypothetical protein